MGMRNERSEDRREPTEETNQRLTREQKKACEAEVCYRFFTARESKKHILRWLLDESEYGKHIAGNEKERRTTANRWFKNAVEKARKAGAISFSWPVDQELRRDVMVAAGLTDTLNCVTVLDTDSVKPLARLIAEEIWREVNAAGAKPDFTIGFFGGRTNSLVAKALVDLSRRGPDNPPALEANCTLTLVSMVGSLYSHRPETDPNDYLRIFRQKTKRMQKWLGRTLVFRSLRTPGLATPDEVPVVRGHVMSRELFDDTPRFDVIVCSTGHLGCRFTLLKYIDTGLKNDPKFAEGVKRLADKMKQLSVLGDIAWHPVTADGPLPETQLNTLPLRVVTLVSLEDIRRQTSDPDGPRTRVFVAVGPCSDSGCPHHRAKGDLLRVILERRPLGELKHTRVFVDSGTARQYVNTKRKGTPPSGPVTTPPPRPMGS